MRRVRRMRRRRGRVVRDGVVIGRHGVGCVSSWDEQASLDFAGEVRGGWFVCVVDTGGSLVGDYRVITKPGKPTFAEWVATLRKAGAAR